MPHLATVFSRLADAPSQMSPCSSAENYDEIITIMKIYLMLRCVVIGCGKSLESRVWTRIALLER